MKTFLFSLLFLTFQAFAFSGMNSTTTERMTNDCFEVSQGGGEKYNCDQCASLECAIWCSTNGGNGGKDFDHQEDALDFLAQGSGGQQYDCDQCASLECSIWCSTNGGNGGKDFERNQSIAL